MSRTRLTLVAALVAALVVVATASAAPVKLTGTVGPGFTITLKKGKKNVKTLEPGTYIFTIQDKSNLHNFHLIGPGVNKKTSVSATGTQKWTLKLKEGTYKYICDPHATIMKGSFKVS